jgi:hypothetical protein
MFAHEGYEKSHLSSVSLFVARKKQMAKNIQKRSDTQDELYPAKLDNGDGKIAYIRQTLPRCPICGSARLRANRSEKWPSGTRIKHSRCLDCGKKVRVIVE